MKKLIKCGRCGCSTDFESETEPPYCRKCFRKVQADKDARMKVDLRRAFTRLAVTGVRFIIGKIK